MEFKIEKDVDHSQEFVRNLSQMKGVAIKAGITKRVAQLQSRKGKEKVVNYAFFNEFGTKHIPERSFLRTTFDDKESSWFNTISNRAEIVITENNGASKITQELGRIMKEAIRGKITSRVPPPNSEATLRQKEGNITLIDTGLMYRVIDFEVVKK
jgi:hypothetical protein